MLDWFTAIMIGIGLLFMFTGIYMIRQNDYFYSFIFTLLATVTFFFLAGGIMEMETPFQIFNNTSGNIETGVHVYNSKIAPETLYYFYMLASVTFILNLAVLFLGLWDYIKKRRGY